MNSALLFEDFSSLTEEPFDEMDPENAALEEERLAAFEKGYGAGWDDALRAQNHAGQLMNEALQASLSDMGFTKAEAMQAFLAASENLFETILGKILPSIASEALANHVLGAIKSALAQSIDSPMQVRVSPSQYAAITQNLSCDLPDGAKVLADPELSEMQAIITLDGNEAEIDLEGLIAEVSLAVSELKTMDQKG